MGGEWKNILLGDFVTLQRGHDLPDQQRRSGTIPILGSFGITGYHDKPRAKGPGITVGRSGASFGVVTYSPVDFWPLNTALYVIDFHGNDPRFAYYFLKKIDFKSYNSGSAQPSLNRNFIHPIPVKVPPLSEQKAIADILGSLDDKIELNRRTNETLEAMARAIFTKWFVTDASENSQDAVLSDLCYRIADKAACASEWANEPLIDLSRMPRKSVALADWGRGAELTTSVVRFRATDTLFGAIRPYFHKVGVAPVNGVTNVSVFVLRAKRHEDWPFLATLCSQPETVEYANRVSKGTKMPVVSWPDLVKMRIPMPNSKDRLRYYEAAVPLYERIIANIHESRVLVRLRDVLLPRLLSGELAVPASKVAG